VWAKERADVLDIIERPQVNHPTCVGFFVGFTLKRLFWNIKPKGQSWNGYYFRNDILIENLIPFLETSANVHGRVEDTMFVHDLAGCYRVKETQTLLDEHGIQHF